MTIVMFMGALFFDLLALIPFLGLLTNFMWGFILYLVYGVNAKGGGMKMAGGTILGFFINLLGDFTLFLAWLPTNIGQLVYALIVDNFNMKEQEKTPAQKSAQT